ncbi:hypothetical protein CH379_016055 [Leptospira ellisii]|uniref:Uncharacterized protein n=1 Tax=Leptospira ellisii TaxID=2023197 RepID=A0A2N0BQR2_9LEPT|nr:hypothetical protein [Leptospira ellisii]MDV6237146.1 hypothetical protein [Leptospira ellisii]PJZ93442.1 hypothetical protein CH379_07835 [Leptospira ellisii]PKA06308.1 hypothetical protein CH375_00275 [Leptospira ellisii]
MCIELESLKLNMRLFDKHRSLGINISDSDLIDFLATRCALQEFYLEQKKLLESYHQWIDDQGLEEWK